MKKGTRTRRIGSVRTRKVQQGRIRNDKEYTGQDRPVDDGIFLSGMLDRVTSRSMSLNIGRLRKCHMNPLKTNPCQISNLPSHALFVDYRLFCSIELQFLVVHQQIKLCIKDIHKYIFISRNYSHTQIVDTS